MRIVVALAAVGVAGYLAGISLAAKSDNAASTAGDAGTPSKLDYLVLASMADTPHLLKMASYHAPTTEHAAPRVAAKPALVMPKSPGHTD